ncbi:MAG: hypothetical protein GY822_28210 [Deltaproteobacteria bacterium]|nr:hypothetical protein [Deltaproteobacteria bacterium]
MSRVEKQNAEAARQADRAQKKINQKSQNAKTSVENKQKFGSMMKRQGESKAKEESQNARQQQGEAKSSQKGGAGNQARLSQMARGGGQHMARMMQQTKGFEGAMSRAKGGAEKENVANDGARDSGLKDAKVGTEERSRDVEGRTETKKESEAEQIKEDMKAEGRVNAAIGGAGGKKGGGGGADSGGQNENQAQELAMKAAKNSGGAQAAQEAKGTQKAGRIPDEIMDKLVKAIFVGVNGEGLKEFQIDLKDGALAGATVKVTAGADGRIALAFENVDKQTKNLLDASKGDLMQRFEDKGLHLGSMRVRAKN